LVTQHHLRAQRERDKYRVLVADDNVVNQKVARITLERLGYRVDTVQDGLQAVAAWQTGRYDLILMDCQMAELDGYEATREIRLRESAGKRIPIIALTAHAVRGADAECAAAGMDGHLAKPVERARLAACLARFLPESPAEALQAEPSRARDSSRGEVAAPPVDLDALRILSEGDSSFERELFADFIAMGSRAVDAIERGLSQGDLQMVAHTAHDVKGASANLHARDSMQLAARLEVAARAGNPTEAAALAERLRAEVNRTTDFLSQLVA
jgi:CheY-like chemotaxis protein